MSRIFISHASADNAAALGLAAWLDNNGWSDFFLDVDDQGGRGIDPGERWMAALAGAVDRCEAVIFLVSPSWRDSKFCFAEFFEARKLGKRTFGVIVQPLALAQLPEQMTAEWQVCDLTVQAVAEDQALSFAVSRPPALAPTTVYFSRVGLDALARGLRKAGLDASTFVWPPDGQPDRSPYPGLRALDEVDAAVFFGRDAAIVRAIDQIRLVRERGVERLFVILGASGAGKSSFLRAGLLPRLRRSDTEFAVLQPIRPERAAISGPQGLLSSLKATLAAAGQVLSMAQLRAALAADGLAGVLARITPLSRHTAPDDRPAPATWIIPIDQAEELFAADGQDEARQLLAHIGAAGAIGGAPPPADPGSAAAAGRAARPRLLFVLTIRSDSLPALQAQAALQALSPVLFSLPAMPASEFKAVIEGPAQRHSASVKPLRIAPQLSERLVHDAQGADALPLLALTLEWLYREFTDAQGTRIGDDEYQRIGGVRGVIGMAVERAIAQPGRTPAIPASQPEQDQLLQQLFPHLATVDPDTGDWKRRVALRDVLRRQAPLADALASRLVEARLLRADAKPAADAAAPVEVVEVAHEALLRQWPAMERWLREFASALAASESIRRAAGDWQRNQQDETLLVHTAHRLKAAEALLGDARLAPRFEPVDRAYVAACSARDARALVQREDQLRSIATQQAARALLQRRAKWGLSVAALAVLALALWIVQQTRQVSLQTSLVLTGAAEAAADAQQFDQSLRLAVLAASNSLLQPAHPSAQLVLARAADGSNLHARLIGHTEAVTSASFSPDGRRAVTASRDGTVRIWDADTGLAVGKPIKPQAAAYNAWFSADGQRVLTQSGQSRGVWDSATGQYTGDVRKTDDASISSDGKRVLLVSGTSATVLDAQTFVATAAPMQHAGRIFDATFSPDSSLVVTASQDKTARIWHAATGLPASQPLLHALPVATARFSPDGKQVVTASDDKTARIWDVATGQPIGQPLLHSLAVNAANFSPKDAGLVLTASDDGTARLWDAATGQATGVVMPHGQAVWAANFSADGKRIITASNDATAGLWHVDTGRLLTRFTAGRESALLQRFSADGKRLLTTSPDNTARVWELDTGKPVGAAMPHAAPVSDATFSVDGRQLLTAAGPQARVWAAATGLPVGQPMVHDNAVSYARFSPDAARIVTFTANSASWVWATGAVKPLFTPAPLALFEYFPAPPEFNADGTLLLQVVMVPLGGNAVIWGANTGTVAGPQFGDGSQWVTSASFSADGSRVLTVGATENLKYDVRVFKLDPRTVLGPPMVHAKTINSARFSPDGQRVVTASTDNTARVWDVVTGKPLGEPMLHGAAVQSADFRRDGQHIVTASADRTVRLWDVQTGKPVGEPLLHSAGVASAAFSTDGTRLVTIADDKTARVWSTHWQSITQPDALIADVCRQKLLGQLRKITEADIRAARILSSRRVGEDVCAGVLAQPAH